MVVEAFRGQRDRWRQRASVGPAAPCEGHCGSVARGRITRTRLQLPKHPRPALRAPPSTRSGQGTADPERREAFLDPALDSDGRHASGRRGAEHQ